MEEWLEARPKLTSAFQISPGDLPALGPHRICSLCFYLGPLSTLSFYSFNYCMDALSS